MAVPPPSNQKKLNEGLQNKEDFEVQKTNLKNALIAFLDSLEQQNESQALSFLSEEQIESSSSINTLLENQMKYVNNTIKENKIFRTVVGLLFLVAVISTAVVGIQHIKFLSEELHVIQVLLANVFLYFTIGVLAFYALSLVIKGSRYNQANLAFFKQILKK